MATITSTKNVELEEENWLFINFFDMRTLYLKFESAAKLDLFSSILEKSVSMAQQKTLHLSTIKRAEKASVPSIDWSLSGKMSLPFAISSDEVSYACRSAFDRVHSAEFRLLGIQGTPERVQARADSNGRLSSFKLKELSLSRPSSDVRQIECASLCVIF